MLCSRAIFCVADKYCSISIVVFYHQHNIVRLASNIVVFLINIFLTGWVTLSFLKDADMQQEDRTPLKTAKEPEGGSVQNREEVYLHSPSPY